MFQEECGGGGRRGEGGGIKKNHAGGAIIAGFFFLFPSISARRSRPTRWLNFPGENETTATSLEGDFFFSSASHIARQVTRPGLHSHTQTHTLSYTHTLSHAHTHIKAPWGVEEEEPLTDCGDQMSGFSPACRSLLINLGFSIKKCK